MQKDLGIQEYTDPHHDPMIPHTLVLKPGLVIHSVYNGYWFWGRPSVDDLRRDLREVTREVRPDWDLSAPGIRENWDTGDHSRHYPYQPAAHGHPGGEYGITYGSRRVQTSRMCRRVTAPSDWLWPNAAVTSGATTSQGGTVASASRSYRARAEYRYSARPATRGGSP